MSLLLLFAPADVPRRPPVKTMNVRARMLEAVLQASRVQGGSKYGEDPGEAGPPGPRVKRGRCVYYRGYLYAPTGVSAHCMTRVRRAKVIRPFIDE